MTQRSTIVVNSGEPTSIQNYNNMYGTARVSDKDQQRRIVCHFIPLFIASLALVISTGIYLFDVEANNSC